MDINEYRQQHPEYEDRSDSELIRAIHRTHYPDRTVDEIAEKMGVSPSVVTPTVTEVPAAPKPGSSPTGALTSSDRAPTGQYTPEGREYLANPDGSHSTEISVTFPVGDKWVNAPSIYGGKTHTEDEARRIVEENDWTDPETGRKLNFFDSQEEAVAAAKERSASIPQFDRQRTGAHAGMDLLEDTPQPTGGATWRETAAAARPVTEGLLKKTIGGYAQQVAADIDPDRMVSPQMAPYMKSEIQAREEELNESQSPLREWGAKTAYEGQQEIEAHTPKNMNALQQAGLTALSSALTGGVAIAAGVLTRSPAPMIATFSAVTYGSSYAEAKGRGLEDKQATLYALTNAAAEAGGEILPAKYLLGAMAKNGDNFLKHALSFLVAEPAGEIGAEEVQMFNDWLHDLRDDVTMNDVIEVAQEAGLASMVGAAGQLSVAGALRNMGEGINKRRSPEQVAADEVEDEINREMESEVDSLEEPGIMSEEVYAEEIDAAPPPQLMEDIQLEEQKELEDVKEDVPGFESDPTRMGQSIDHPRMAKFLTAEERQKLNKGTAERFAEIVAEMPSGQELASVAWDAQAKRGWYAEYVKSIGSFFGEDSPRFTALLAGLSPQTDVRANLWNTLSTWMNWIQAGRPQTREEIIAIMGASVQGERGEDSVLNAWKNNAVSALTEEMGPQFILSGPKVDSFYRNLMGDTNAVTNDTHIARMLGVEQAIFGGSRTQTDAGKGTGYLAASARQREAASILTKNTGELWTPDQVQETIWSWGYALTNKRKAQGEGRSVGELVAAGEPVESDLTSVPDFATIMRDDPALASFREALGLASVERGLRAPDGDTARSDVEGSSGTGRRSDRAPRPGIPPERFERHLEKSADRLERSLQMPARRSPAFEQPSKIEPLFTGPGPHPVEPKRGFPATTEIALQWAHKAVMDTIPFNDDSYQEAPKLDYGMSGRWGFSASFNTANAKIRHDFDAVSQVAGKPAIKTDWWLNNMRHLLFDHTHEVGHKVDFLPTRHHNLTVVHKSDALSLSSLSPLVKVPEFGSANFEDELGPVLKEAYEHYLLFPDDALTKILAYPLGSVASMEQTDDPDIYAGYTQHVQSELFAQLFALHYNYPDLLRKNLPQAHAFMQEVHHEEDSIVRSADTGAETPDKSLRGLLRAFQVNGATLTAAVRERTDHAVGKVASGQETHKGTTRNADLLRGTADLYRNRRPPEPPPGKTPKKPVRRGPIIKQLQRDLGMTVYFGRVKKKRTVAGYHDEVSGEVRVRKLNDLEIVAHELGHWLAKRYPSLQKAYEKPWFGAELAAISQYASTDVHEGFAEFVRAYLTQNQLAHELAPNFYDAFEKIVAKHPKLVKALRNARISMTDWYMQGAEARAESKIGRDKQSFTQWMQSGTEYLGDMAILNIVDQFHGIKVTERLLTGKIADAATSPYKQVRLLQGSRGVMRAIIYRGTLNWNENGDLSFTGIGVEEVFYNVRSKIENTMKYFAGVRAKELLGQGRENNFSPDEIEALLRHGNDPDIAQAFRDFRAFMKRHMDFLQDSGLISADARLRVEEMNKDYVPFHRVIEEFGGRKQIGFQKPFQRLKGGTANVKDIWENIIYSLANTTHAALQNRVKQSLYDMIDAAGHNSSFFAVKASTDSKKHRVDTEQVIAKLEKLGLQIEGDMAADFITFFTHGHAPVGKQFDMVLREGKAEYYEIGKSKAGQLLFESIEAMGPGISGLGIRILGAPKRLFTRGITSLPPFLLPNFYRDTLTAAVLSEGGLIPFIDSGNGFAERLAAAFGPRGKGEAYWEYMANGGGFSSTVHGETQEARDKIETLYASAMRDSKLKYLVVDTPRKAIEAWDEFASTFEYANRVGEYIANRRKGKGKRESAYAGSEISTDFRMRGKSILMQYIVAGAPFLNARMQGLYRMPRVVGTDQSQKEHLARLMLTGFALITVPSLIAIMLAWDDERYQSLPDWIKDTHMVILLDDLVILIPQPFELGAIFGTIPARIYEYARTGDELRLMQAASFLLFEALALNPVPLIARPFIETEWTNRKFTGAQIIPESMKGAEAWVQYKPWTPEIMKRAADFAGVPALKMEHWFNGFLGTLGIWINQSSEVILNPDRPETHWQEMQVLNRFFRKKPYRGTQAERQVYELVKVVRGLERTQNAMLTNLSSAEEMTRFGETEAELAIIGTKKAGITKDLGITQAEMIKLGPQINNITSSAAKIRKAMKQVYVDKDLDRKEKKKKIEDLQGQMNEVFQSAQDAGLTLHQIGKLKEHAKAATQ